MSQTQVNPGNISPAISVILPVFNGEETIEWTVESVLRQTFQDFELICVNDCSTDGTMAKLLHLAASDTRVKVIDNEMNQGLGKSRNLGIRVAKGEYLAFIDSDDFYEIDFLEKLYGLVVAHSADISQCAVRYVYNDRDLLYGSPAGQIAGEHCQYRIDIGDGLPFVNPQAWNKLYRKNLFDQWSYQPICYEDAQILPGLLSGCNKIVSTDEVLFNYNKRFSGLTGEKYIPVSKVDWYLESLITSIQPYFEDRFLALISKWRVPFPRCTIENYKNFFKMLKGSIALYSQDEKKEIQEKIKANLLDIERVVPKSYFNDYVKAADDFCSVLEVRKRRMNSILGAVSSAVQRGSNLFLIFCERAISTMDRAFPKDKNLWVFSSWGKYSNHTLDNPRALFERVKGDPLIKKVVVINSADRVVAQHVHDELNVEFVYLKSLRGLYFLLRSGVLVTGYSLHNLFGYRRLKEKNGRCVVQLWHGIPVKKVGLEVGQNLEHYWDCEARKYSILVSCSEPDREIMVKSFSPSMPSKVKLTGLPRHDFITCDEEQLPTDFREHLRNLKLRIGGRKFILFAPTWRYGYEAPCMFTNSELEILDDLLSKKNAVLGIRIHPNMKASGLNSGFVSDNIFNVDDVPDTSIPLRLAELLISDYSSIYIDFMLTERPVLLYTQDVNSYSGVRGFNYLPEEFVPHQKTYSDFASVYRAVSEFVDGASLKDGRYDSVKKRFLAFSSDSSNGARVLEHVQGELH